MYMKISLCNDTTNGETPSNRFEIRFEESSSLPSNTRSRYYRSEHTGRNYRDFVSSEMALADTGRDFGDNCFSISSFATFNLVLLNTVINVITNLNSNNNDNNNNNNNNLNRNQNGQGGGGKRRRRRRDFSDDNPFLEAALKTAHWQQVSNRPDSAS